MRLGISVRIGLILLALGVTSAPAQEPPEGSDQVLRIGINRDYAPYEFLDEDGQPSGYCISLIRAVAEVKQLRLEIVPGPWSERLEYLKYIHNMATATLPQSAVAEFLAKGGYDRYLRKVRRQYAHQVERVTHAVGRFFPAGTRVTHPTGGFVLWVQLPGAADSTELYRRAFALDISVAPGPLFSAKGKYRDFIRLNCAQPWSERLEQALLTLGRLSAELAGG